MLCHEIERACSVVGQYALRDVFAFVFEEGVGVSSFDFGGD